MVNPENLQLVSARLGRFEELNIKLDTAVRLW